MTIENRTGNPELNFILNVVIPVYTVKQDGELFYPDQIGSGFLFETNKMVFLVTAAHIIHDYGTNIFLPLPEKKQFPPSGDIIFASRPEVEPGGPLDNIDIACVKLDNPDPLRSEYTITNSSYCFIDTKGEFDEKIDYIHCGYPAIYAKVENHSIDSGVAQAECFTYICKYAGKFISSEYNKATHYSIEYKRETINTRTSEKAFAPLGQGLSGSPIWTNAIDKQGKKTFRIIGMFIEHHRDHDIVYAPRIHHILYAIGKTYGLNKI